MGDRDELEVAVMPQDNAFTFGVPCPWCMEYEGDHSRCSAEAMAAAHGAAPDRTITIDRAAWLAASAEIARLWRRVEELEVENERLRADPLSGMVPMEVCPTCRKPEPCLCGIGPTPWPGAA